MQQLRSYTHLLRPIAAVLLVASFQGCTRWRYLPDPMALAATPQKTVRVTTDGDPRHLIVQNATISGDSIVWSAPKRGGIPLTEVVWVEARAPDRMATGFLLLVTVGFSSLIALLQ